jgi:hypothetical protein
VIAVCLQHHDEYEVGRKDVVVCGGNGAAVIAAVVVVTCCHCCRCCGRGVGSEQALAPVREPDTVCDHSLSYVLGTGIGDGPATLARLRVPKPPGSGPPMPRLTSLYLSCTNSIFENLISATAGNMGKYDSGVGKQPSI